MRVLIALSFLVAALSGCANVEDPDFASSMVDTDGDGVIDAIEVKYGSDPDNATDVPHLMKHADVSYTNTVQVVGNGVPGVQCDPTPVSSQVMTWTIEAPPGNVTNVHVGHLEFTITSAATVNDADIFVTGPDGATASATSGAASETASFNGHQPVGDYTIEIRGCSGAGDVTVDATGSLGWLPSEADLLAEGHGDDGHTH